MRQKTIQITEEDIRNMVGKSVKRLLREYWTGADDFAADAHRRAEERIEKEFQELIHNGNYDRDLERLEHNYELFLDEFQRQKKWLEGKIGFKKRFEKGQYIGGGIGYDIAIRRVDGGVIEKTKNVDFMHGHSLKYQGNSYEAGTLDYNKEDQLVITVEFSLEPEHEHEEHIFTPTNGYWRTNDAGERTRIPNPDTNFQSEYVGPGDRSGDEIWTSPSPDWKHKVKKERFFSSRWLDENEPEDMDKAFAALAIKRLAEKGKEYGRRWTIDKERRGNYRATIYS